MTPGLFTQQQPQTSPTAGAQPAGGNRLLDLARGWGQQAQQGGFPQIPKPMMPQMPQAAQGFMNKPPLPQVGAASGNGLLDLQGPKPPMAGGPPTSPMPAPMPQPQTSPLPPTFASQPQISNVQPQAKPMPPDVMARRPPMAPQPSPWASAPAQPAGDASAQQFNTFNRMY